MVGEAVLTSCHVLNKVPNKNQDQTPYEMWNGRKPSLSYLRTWGCLTKVNVPIPKKRKLGPKTVDYVFLEYAQRSIAYRFLVVNLRYQMCMLILLWNLVMQHFFENIFPMKNMHSNSRFSTEITTQPAAPIESSE